MATGGGIRFALDPPRNKVRPATSATSRTAAIVQAMKRRLMNPRGAAAPSGNGSGQAPLAPDANLFPFAFVGTSSGQLMLRRTGTDIRYPTLGTVLMISSSPRTFLSFETAVASEAP